MHFLTGQTTLCSWYVWWNIIVVCFLHVSQSVDWQMVNFLCTESWIIKCLNPLPVPYITYDTHWRLSDDIKQRLDRQRVNMEHLHFWLLVVIYFGIKDGSSSNIKPKDKSLIPTRVYWVWQIGGSIKFCPNYSTIFQTNRFCLRSWNGRGAKGLILICYTSKNI